MQGPGKLLVLDEAEITLPPFGRVHWSVKKLRNIPRPAKSLDVTSTPIPDTTTDLKAYSDISVSQQFLGEAAFPRRVPRTS